ncbi:MAG TPA: D-alanine--D-alanine ligase family protein [Actinomycetota bacterium]|nr:D-alanine--D-alanine ligase family protein [Actinomycetota bacterium]
MKTRVVLLFGGQSAEHDVSCVSARHVAAAMDPARYVVIPVGITAEGDWVLPELAMQVLAGGALQVPNDRFVAEGTKLELFGGLGRHTAGSGAGAYGLKAPTLACDVVFPVLHGPFGEDGSVQGFLEMAGVPYVGSGVLGSAVGMDKQMMKLAFAAAGLPSPRYEVFRLTEWHSDREAVLDRSSALGFPLFTKPANLGSSVGISRCPDAGSLEAGIDLAFRYDRKILVEEGVGGREIECAVLGNDDPQASVCGEIIPGRDFYDYEAKYLEPSSKTVVPADLPEGVGETIRRHAVTAFKAVEAAGLSRVDFFVAGDGRVLINEINTMPGFTEISMFPKLWGATGIGYSELIDRLIELALERAGAAS